eukprot:364028-Chlamydomonas_euryale.AAC.1
MAVTVFLVRVLNPDGESSAISVYMASAVYDEGAHVSTWSRGFGTHASVASAGFNVGVFERS